MTNAEGDRGTERLPVIEMWGSDTDALWEALQRVWQKPELLFQAGKQEVDELARKLQREKAEGKYWTSDEVVQVCGVLFSKIDPYWVAYSSYGICPGDLEVKTPCKEGMWRYFIAAQLKPTGALPEEADKRRH